MTDQDAASAMAAMDGDGSGEVDKAEFKTWFKTMSEPVAVSTASGSLLPDSACCANTYETDLNKLVSCHCNACGDCSLGRAVVHSSRCEHGLHLLVLPSMD
eukprot:SAG31_NODE_2031_length_6627_cov_1.575368_2_plen_101_part_00